MSHPLTPLSRYDISLAVLRLCALVLGVVGSVILATFGRCQATAAGLIVEELALGGIMVAVMVDIINRHGLTGKLSKQMQREWIWSRECWTSSLFLLGIMTTIYLWTWRMS